MPKILGMEVVSARVNRGMVPQKVDLYVCSVRSILLRFDNQAACVAYTKMAAAEDYKKRSP